MQLIYRGVRYRSSETAVDTVEGSVIGKYRGTVIRAHAPRTPLSKEASASLRYRGCSYFR